MDLRVDPWHLVVQMIIVLVITAQRIMLMQLHGHEHKACSWYNSLIPSPMKNKLLLARDAMKHQPDDGTMCQCVEPHFATAPSLQCIQEYTC